MSNRVIRWATIAAVCLAFFLFLAAGCTTGGGDEGGGRPADDDDSSGDDTADDDDSGDDTDDDDDSGDDTDDDDDTGCDPPSAAFSADPRAGDAPLAVAFTDESTAEGGCPITSWDWDFGDGATSDQPDPSHEYEAGGTYTITLTVENEGGVDAETKTDYVAVSCPIPVANFSGTPRIGPIPLTVQFSDESAVFCDGATYAWTFGDGATSVLRNPSHQYQNPGWYAVSLTVTTDGGVDTETKTDYVHATCSVPVAGFSAYPTSGRKPLTVQFTDASASNCPVTSRLWTFGDGGTSTEASPSHQYANVGNYTVSLQITSDGGSDTETKTNYVAVADNPVVGLLETTDARDVYVSGHCAVIANGEDGLVTADVTDPTDPVAVDVVDSRTYTGVHVAGGYAYVADPNIGDGIHIFSLNASTCEVGYAGGYYHDGWSTNDVYVVGTTAYLAASGQGLAIVNVANPASPSLIKTVDTAGYSVKVQVQGNYAFLADGSSGVVVVDVSNPATAAIAGTVDTYDATGYWPAGRYGFVAEETGGMSVLDVFGVYPAQVGEVSGGWITDVVVSGNYAYGSNYSGTMRVYNVANPASPSLAGSTAITGYPEGIFKSGNYAYVAAENGGLVIVNVATPGSPSVVGTYDTASSDCRDVFVVGTTAYVANGENGLWKLDVANPASPSFLAAGGERTAVGIHVVGNYVYVADPNIGDGMFVYNTSNLSYAGGYEHAGWSIGDVFVSGNYAFLANDDEMDVLNVTTPSNPTFVTSVTIPIYADKISVDGNYAYLSLGSAGFVIVDITNPASPVVVGQANTYEANQALGVGRYTYVADSDGLKIFDSLGVHPQIIGDFSYAGSFSEDVLVSGNYAYIADYGPLTVVNVADRTNPLLANALATGGYAEGVFESGSYIYVAVSEVGMLVVNKYPTHW